MSIYHLEIGFTVDIVVKEDRPNDVPSASETGPHRHLGPVVPPLVVELFWRMPFIPVCHKIVRVDLGIESETGLVPYQQVI